jgi:hypothetical protein
MLKRLATIALGLAVTVAGLAFAPAAQAAPSTAGCYGASCQGLDPADQGCGGAYTVGSVSTPQVYVELRYSPVCNANWARISSSSPGTWFYTQDCITGYNTQFSIPSGYASGWSDMVNGPDLARAGTLGGHTSCL